MLEVKTIEELSYIANKDTGVGLSIVALDWVQDGIEELEIEAIDWMNNFGDAGVASSVVSLGWMQDGIEELEVTTIEKLSYIANKDRGVGLSIVALDWVQDGIEDSEVDLIDTLASIANKNAGEALRIVSMPFLETVEPPDISAINSLRLLAAFEPETFVRVMSHAALLDGISNDIAPIVATLRGVADTNSRVLLTSCSIPPEVFSGTADRKVAVVR